MENISLILTYTDDLPLIDMAKVQGRFQGDTGHATVLRRGALVDNYTQSEWQDF